jgi:hypothetical protein
MLSGRWQFWHDRCKIGAISFVNVTWLWAGALAAIPTMAARPTGIRFIKPLRIVMLLYRYIPDGNMVHPDYITGQ